MMMMMMIRGLRQVVSNGPKKRVKMKPIGFLTTTKGQPAQLRMAQCSAAQCDDADKKDGWAGGEARNEGKSIHAGFVDMSFVLCPLSFFFFFISERIGIPVSQGVWVVEVYFAQWVKNKDKPVWLLDAWINRSNGSKSRFLASRGCYPV